MEPNEKEYEYYNIIINQHNNNKIEISSLSIKSGIEESKSNHSIKNDNIINFYKKNKNKLDIIISPSNKHKHNNTNNINNDKKSIFDYTDNLYNSDEHLSKIELIKCKNNQENVPNISQIKRPQSYDKNFEKKTSLSKHDDDNHKIFRKSLFHSKNIKKEEDKKNRSKKSLILIKNKKKANAQEFFKLMEKNKKPQKSSYIDSLINNNTYNSKFNSSIKKHIIKKNSFKSITTQKVLQRNKTFNTQKEIIMQQKEKKKQEDFHMVIKKKNKINLEDMNANAKETQNSENTKNNNIKSINCINWTRIKFLCCLNCN